MALFGGNLNVTSYTRFILIFVLVITYITENTYDYIQYNAVWQAHASVPNRFSLKGREGTNISTLCYFSFALC